MEIENNFIECNICKKIFKTQHGLKIHISKIHPKEIEEIRPFPWISSLNQKLKDRIHRAINQKMFLISRREINSFEQHFIVLGSVGNVYTVIINSKPQCSCPDFQKGNSCKHILFVFLKVLKLPPESELIYQRGLLSSEIKEIFHNAPPDPTIMANIQVQKKYIEIVEGKSENSIKRRSIEGDCPICYEEMKSSEQLVWCKNSCGNNIHLECFNNWCKSKNNMEEITCVYCRALWNQDKTHLTSEGYINLGNFQPGMNTQREDYYFSYF